MPDHVDTSEDGSALILSDEAWKDLAEIATAFLDRYDVTPRGVDLERQLVLARRIVEVA